KWEGEKCVFFVLLDVVVICILWVFSEYGVNFVKIMLWLVEICSEISVVND
ncbi:dTDP-4-dehydrorhamnose reductase, partial [Enterococcus hirae]